MLIATATIGWTDIVKYSTQKIDCTAGVNSQCRDINSCDGHAVHRNKSRFPRHVICRFARVHAGRLRSRVQVSTRAFLDSSALNDQVRWGGLRVRAGAHRVCLTHLHNTDDAKQRAEHLQPVEK